MEAEAPGREGDTRFPQTHWTLIRSAARKQADQGRAALDRLLRIYRPVLLWYLTVQRRMLAADAEDLLQGFVLDKVLESSLLQRAEPAQGRFRSLLLTALDNYRLSRHRFDGAQRRAPAGGMSDDLEAAENVAAEGEDPAVGLDAVWARRVIDQAVEQMRQECAAGGRADLWAVFDERLLRPARNGGEPPSYEELAPRLRLGSPTQAANLLITAKRMLRRHVEQVVCEYAADPRDAEAEVRDLLAAAGGLA